MSEIRKIIVPTDFSEAADAALLYAANLTKGYPEKEVIFMHVSPCYSELAEQQLAAVKEKFSTLSDASCHATQGQGSLTEAVLQYQKQYQYDLIVMGTEGGEDSNALSNGSEMVMVSDCPVLLIPNTVVPDSVKNIALAIDKASIDDSASLGVLHGLAREKDAKIHVLTVDNGRGGLNENPNEAVLDYYLETLDYRYVFPNNTDIELGINEYIAKNDIDLLVILPRNHAEKSIPSEGQLTKVLTQHARIPILAID